MSVSVEKFILSNIDQTEQVQEALIILSLSLITQKLAKVHIRHD